MNIENCRLAPRYARTGRRRARGISLVELALVLPVLLLLVLGVVDFSRAIQFNNILVNLTREGANLSARTTEQPPYILRALIEAHDAGEGLTELEIIHNCVFMLNAGHDTTTSLIANGVHLLLEHPGEFERVENTANLGVQVADKRIIFPAVGADGLGGPGKRGEPFVPQSRSATDGRTASYLTPSGSASCIASDARLPPMSVEPSIRLIVPSEFTPATTLDCMPALNQKPEATPRPRFGPSIGDL